MIYFKKEEFRMGNENVFNKMDSKFLVLLDQLRERVGEPLVITSSYRSVEYNKSIGGAPSSFHILGFAADLGCGNGILRAKIVYHALGLGLSVGTYQGWVHIDNRTEQLLYVG